MLVLKSLIACDKKTRNFLSLNNNLTSVPGWIAGNSLSVSKWSMNIVTTNCTTALTNLSYPISVHHVFGSENTLTSIKIFRSVGAHQLYFEMNLQPTNCTILDIRIEFEQQVVE